MDDLDRYINKRKKTDPEFAEGYDEGYEHFKIGVMLREARVSCGLTQAELANSINTTKSAISRLENHAEDIRLSTLDKVANALGKTLKISIN
ncbi:hypothetical protein ES708_28548 [subsurface metagenome]